MATADVEGVYLLDEVVIEGDTTQGPVALVVTAPSAVYLEIATQRSVLRRLAAALRGANNSVMFGFGNLAFFKTESGISHVRVAEL